MSTRKHFDHFTTRVLSSLVASAAIALGSLAYAVSHIQVVV